MYGSLNDAMGNSNPMKAAEDAGTKSVYWKMDRGVISMGEPGGDVIALDLEGRIIYASISGITIRRTLLNRFIEMRIVSGKRLLRELNASESQMAVSRIREKAMILVGGIRDRQALHYMSGLVERLDFNWLQNDATFIMKVYGGGVPIVPPDQYFSLYVRYTVGCSWNRCSFCRLYPGQKYSVHTFQEVERQVSQLSAVLGKGMASRRSVFLGDANAVNTKIDQLIDVIGLLRNRLGLPVYAFSDAFTTPRTKDTADYLKMHESGLTRIYIGIESGDVDVLKILNKPMNLETAMEEIYAMKSAGISLGIILMAGAGGITYSQSHVKNSVNFVSRLPLDRRDVVFISPLFEYSDSEYYKIATSCGLGIMSAEEKERQTEAIRKGIRENWMLEHHEKPEFPIAPYVLTESIY